MVTARLCDRCGVRFMGRDARQRYCTDAHRIAAGPGPGYYSPSTERGAAANARKAALPCSVRGCLQARYCGPAGDARSRCPEHEATAARERYAARRPSYQPRPAGRGSRPTVS